MTAPNATERRQLARHLLDAAFGGVPPLPRPNLPQVTSAVAAIVAAPAALSGTDEAFLVRLAAEADLSTVSGNRVNRLLAIFGGPEVERRWAAAPSATRRTPPLTPPAPVLRAAVRVALDPANATAQDTTTLDSWVITKGRTVPSMADFEAESRGLPSVFDERTFVQSVTDRLSELGGNVSAPFIAVVAGRLLLDSNTDPKRSDFKFAVKRAYDIGVEVIREHAERPQQEALREHRGRLQGAATPPDDPLPGAGGRRRPRHRLRRGGVGHHRQGQPASPGRGRLHPVRRRLRRHRVHRARPPADHQRGRLEPGDRNRPTSSRWP